MLRTILPVILELLAAWLFFGHALMRLVLPKRKKNALTVKEFHQHLKKTRLINRDVLPGEALAGIDETMRLLGGFREAGDFDGEKTAAILKQADQTLAATVPKKFQKRGMVAEYLEIFIVALGVAFGIRAIFLQPFKIPTGSMQPTLYGIHFVSDDDVKIPSAAGKVIHWLHASRRYVDLSIKESGFIRGFRQVSPTIPFFPKTAFFIGNHEYILPGKPIDAAKCNEQLKNFFKKRENYEFSKGEVLAKGYLLSGDHVFVNRTALNFKEPGRGDITVFMTDGIVYKGGKLNGRYYIKRLVGLPGDTLKINDKDQLMVKEAGESTFRLAAEDKNPAFRRINSFKGGYRGHTATMGKDQRFLMPGTSYTVPEDHYFMLGDNSPESLDSRFWGPVPRENLVGKASLVWWPASRRWGLTDTVEPADDTKNISSSGQVE